LHFLNNILQWRLNFGGRRLTMAFFAEQVTKFIADHPTYLLIDPKEAPQAVQEATKRGVVTAGALLGIIGVEGLDILQGLYLTDNYQNLA
jgi:hypothetical protein